MATVIHDPIAEHEGGAFAAALADQLAGAAAWLDGRPGLVPDARRALVTQLARRWLGCGLTAFVEDGAAPDGPAAWGAWFARYPVCRRLFSEAERAWRADCDQLLAATARAYPDTRLAGVEHDAGFLGSRRSAHVLSLEDGRRTVYRPYQLAAAAWFVEVCAALNRAGLDPPFHIRELRVEDTHTWDMHVVARPCTEPAQIARFFRRAGCYVRLLEAVRAVDLHLRNVLLLGEHLVILDLEGVLAWRGEPSPLASGLLPVRWPGPEGAPINLGGLNLGGTLTLPVRQPRLRAGKLEHVYPTKDVQATVPAPPSEYADEIVAGYDQLDELLGRVALDALVARTRSLKTRVFGRSGFAYRALLFASMAPALLRDEAAREAFIVANAEPLERSSLRALRVPRFIGNAAEPVLRPHSPGVRALNEQRIRAALAP